MNESKYIDNKSYLKRYGSEETIALRDSGARLAAGADGYEAWLRLVTHQFPRLVQCLTGAHGIEFRGRILEIGAGAGWLSAELSKLPRVVEITAIDVSPRLLKEEAPKIFELLKASTSKIIRTPGDCHLLDFPDNYFDFVVCASVLHYVENMVQVLREARRVLKPGGQFVAVREPVWPLLKVRSRAKMTQRLVTTGYDEKFYTLAEYRQFFTQAGLTLEARRVNISTGFKYYINKVVNGLTHARYAFVAAKKHSAVAKRAEPRPRPTASSAVRRKGSYRSSRKRQKPF
jgi:ubiquinone/menaquinone biosynthesis C-methylase UbiE